MALPYPEGEVFFKRSVLKKNTNGLDPDNLASFNSHALVEWCWNDNVAGSGFSRNRICHISGQKDEKKQFKYWEAMIVSFGTKEGFENPIWRETDGLHYSRHSDIKRVVKTMLPDDTDAYETRANNGPVMTAVTPIKLEPSQPYMYIDLNVPIRAVYFPLAQKPSTVFPDLCSYLMVDFRMRQSVYMYDVVKEDAEELRRVDEIRKQEEAGREKLKSTTIPISRKSLEKLIAGREWILDENGHRWRKVNFDHYRGLVGLSSYMISLYIPGIYNYLILPRPLRSVERGLFMPKDHTKSLIRIHDRDAINSMSNLIEPERITQNLCLKLDMTEILEGHLGVQVVWQPVDIPEPEDANKMFKDLVEAGLCFVPVVGPLASTCFSLFMDIVNNPEAFEEKDPLDLGGTLLGDVASSAEAIADGLPKYSKAGKLFGFLGKIGGAVTKLAKE